MSGRRIGLPRSAPRSRNRARLHPRLEALEARELLATFTVTNTGDLTPSGAIVAGSLRDAINRSNQTAGADIIKFDIPGSGVHTISFLAAMLSVTDPVTIDGTSQPGFTGTPVIVLDGTLAGAGANGLTIASSGTTIEALVINKFKGDGLLIDVGDTTVTGSFIGTDASGSLDRGNGGDGIHIKDSSNDVIGGTTAAQRNVISANASHGIGIEGDSSTGNQILGNFIGVDGSGSRALGNHGDGVSFFGGSFNQVGSPDPGGGNVISGNLGNGINLFSAGARGNAVEGNLIGTDATGMGGIGNAFNGIQITGAPDNVIGAPNPGGPSTVLGARNVISANMFDGIGMVGGDGTTIQNNDIGTDIKGAGALGNLGPGVADNGGNNLLVGGTIAGAGNVIAFNGATFKDGGVNLFSGTASSVLTNSIFSNFGLGIVHSAYKDFPVLTLAGTGAGRTKIQGTFTNTPNTAFLIQFFTNPSLDSNGQGEGKFFLGSRSITTDDTGTGTIDVTLATPSQIGQFLTATLTDPAGNTSEFSAAVPVVKSSIANIGVTLTANPSPATLGGTLTYTVKVTNSGPDKAPNVTLVDTLPANASFVSAATDHGSVSQVGARVIGTLGDLAQGETATVTITVTPTQTGTITDTVTADSSAIDPDTSNNTVKVDTKVNIPADLAVKIVATPEPVTIGANLTYVVTVTDGGPGPSSNVVLTDTLPAGVNVVTVDSGQGSFTQIGNTLTFSIGALANGISSAVRIVVIPSVAGTITNTATVTGAEIDPVLTNNTATATSTVLPAADLSVALSSDHDSTPVLTGQDVTYTAVVTNNGPSPATGVTLTDPLPPGVTFVSATGGTTPNATGNVVFTIGALAVKASATVTLVVAPTVSGSLTDTITAAGAEKDPVPANNTGSDTVLVNPADLGITITPSPVPAFAGSPLTYVVTVTNNGPSAATNAIVTDILPAGLALSMAPSVSQGSIVSTSGGTVVANLGLIPFSQSATLTLIVTPTGSGVVTDTASVKADQVDSNPANNTTTVNTLVSPADLAVTMTASSLQSIVGDQVTFTMTVMNNGPAAATGVNLNDTLPTGARFVSASSSQGTVVLLGGSVVASIGSLPVGGLATVTVVVSPTVEGAITNSAVVTADQVDSDTSNNSASVSSAVVNLPGVIQFAQPVYTVKENAGAAVITVVRTGGTKGTLAVNFAAINGTGIDGLNFRSTSGTLVFQNGQSSQSFVVPVLDDGQQDGDHTVSLLLGDAGGTPLGLRTTATLNIVNTDVDFNGPTVRDIQLLGSGGSVTGVVLTFTKALDPARAQDPANYFLAAPVGRRFRRSTGGPVAIASVTYTPGGKTVLVTPSQPLRAGVFYEIAVNGTSATGLTDLFGNLLNSNSQTGIPASNYVATFGRGSNLTYGDSGGNSVNLRLSGGGVIDLFRAANGDGEIMRLIGTVPGRSTISGNVRRLGPRSSGVTTLSTIQGLGAFGAVRSRLKTPPFIVTEQTLPPVQTAAFVAPASLFSHRPMRKFR